jgi:hypothetical protein
MWPPVPRHHPEPALCEAPVREDGIPDDVASFLTEEIRSVTELELLLHLRGAAGRDWTPDAVAGELYIDRSAAAQLLRDLASRGFLTAVASGNGSYRFGPNEDARRRALDRVAHLYATRRVTIIGLIFAAPQSRRSDNLRSFSDAFRLRGGTE